MTQLRANGDLAGTTCLYKKNSHRCNQYARYAVGDGLTEFPTGYCGTHVADGIRAVWKDKKQAAIVQEIPGMWR